MLTAHGVTHVGHVRKTNEDSLLVDLDLGLFLVADGMGGHIAGEVASRMAVETIRAFIGRSQDGGNCTWPFGIDPDASFAVNRLNTAVKLANRRVFRASESVDDYTGMGTTIVAILVEGDRVAFAAVGDSRLYACTGDKANQLTSDDSWAATILARDPELDETALAAHPMRHVLTNAIGARDDTDVEVGEWTWTDGEALLLCTDGLYGALDDQTLARLSTGAGPVEACAQLLEAALASDGKDNITAVVLSRGE